jgi:hypothetical protein
MSMLVIRLAESRDRDLGFAIAARLPKAFLHPQLGYVDAFVMYRPVIFLLRLIDRKTAAIALRLIAAIMPLAKNTGLETTCLIC